MDSTQTNSNIQSRFGNITFTAIDIGKIPESTDIPMYHDFPDGFNSNNTFLIAIRVLRNNGQFVYSDNGQTCNVIFDRGRISVYATDYGLQYCHGEKISCLLAKI